MLERIKYINHINESFTGGEKGLYINKNDLRNYSWSYISNNDIVTHFYKNQVTKKIPFIIYCQNAEEGKRIANQIYEIIEKDIINRQPGKIFIGDFYMRCYCIGITYEEYLIKKGYLKAELNVISEKPIWIKETNFYYGNEIIDHQTDEDYLDYPYDYMYDYGKIQGNNLVNNNFSNSDFRMLIFGEAVNPSILIGNNRYQVNCTVGHEEYLEIDSIKKTIVLHKINGSTENLFNSRNRENYIFKLIETGKNEISWNNLTKIQIILYEERSTPKWK